MIRIPSGGANIDTCGLPSPSLGIQRLSWFFSFGMPEKTMMGGHTITSVALVTFDMMVFTETPEGGPKW
eukprot:3681360-Pyramimonas_sp.AAC.1